MNIFTDIDSLSNEERHEKWKRALKFFGSAEPLFMCTVRPVIKINLATARKNRKLLTYLKDFSGWLVILGICYGVLMQ